MNETMPCKARFASGLAMMLLLGACVPRTTADVTRFHQLAGAQSGTVTIVHADPGETASLAFQKYADLIGAHLAAQGWRPASSQSATDITARVDYGVTPFDGAVENSGSRVSVGVGVGSHGSGVNVGVSDILGNRRRDQNFVHRLSITMVRNADGQVVFEGRATSTGPDQQIAAVMPFLVDALFTGFPGRSGSTITVTAPPPPRGP